MGVCQGLFGLFTMYLPPLFPTLLRTTGAGFCYNIGRIAAAGAVVFFGLFSKVGDPASSCSTPPSSSCRPPPWPCCCPNRPTRAGCGPRERRLLPLRRGGEEITSQMKRRAWPDAHEALHAHHFVLGTTLPDGSPAAGPTQVSEA